MVTDCGVNGEGIDAHLFWTKRKPLIPPFPALSSKQKQGSSRHLMLNLPPKRPATSPAMSLSIAKKTRKSLTLKFKLDIIQRHDKREN
ncbi:hypothetical protein E2C01_064768 [Portunus trituberculatus]|uniref:Uncharacterized protein n=1 Tax=Portunus trituberculatus TaxID=210409 RepID=A0A5B7HPA4_PORTR|nr:hypothetical protein [Portunus trituberculatus]